MKTFLSKSFLRSLILLFGTMFCLSFIGPNLVLAASVSQTDKDAIVGDWPHWLVESGRGKLDNCVADDSTGSPTTTGGVYMVGDSIGVIAQNALANNLSSKGYNFLPNNLSSRFLSGGSVSPDGLAAVNQPADRAFIQTAVAVVIELGTNAGVEVADINTMISSIRSINPSVQIYWVDTVVVNRGIVANSFSITNQRIYAQSTTNNFKVISWAKKVLGNAADPQAISPTADDPNNYIDPNLSTGLGVHPSVPAGAKALADLIANAVTTGGSGDCAGGGTILPGDCNQDKIWNYLIKKGLSQVQVAGFMGNLQAESHFESRLVQYGKINSRGEISVQGQPSSLSDDIVINGSSGYGLAQWTSAGRQAGLHNLALSKHTIDGDLGTQLDWLWHELTTSYNVSVYTPLKAETNLRAASNIVLFRFESPADQGQGVQDARASLGNQILTKLGGGASSCGTSH